MEVIEMCYELRKVPGSARRPTDYLAMATRDRKRSAHSSHHRWRCKSVQVIEKGCSKWYAIEVGNDAVATMFEHLLERVEEVSKRPESQNRDCIPLHWDEMGSCGLLEASSFRYHPHPTPREVQTM